MDNLKYKILKDVHESSLAHPVRKTNYYTEAESIMQYKRAIDDLIQAGFVRQSCNSDTLTITEDGVRGLERMEEELLTRQENLRKEQEEKEEKRRIFEAERTERKKEKRSDRRFQLFLAVFQAFLSVVSGVLIEHFFGIVDLVMRLFD